MEGVRMRGDRFTEEEEEDKARQRRKIQLKFSSDWNILNSLGAVRSHLMWHQSSQESQDGNDGFEWRNYHKQSIFLGQDSS